MKTFVDEVSTLAVELCLVQRLPSILSPEVICSLTDDEVRAIAGESDDIAEERAQATEKLSVLQRALEDLTRLWMHRGSTYSD